MGVLIDDVFAGIEGPETGTPSSVRQQSENEGVKEGISDMTLSDQISRIEKRQLRLMAD